MCFEHHVSAIESDTQIFKVSMMVVYFLVCCKISQILEKSKTAVFLNKAILEAMTSVSEENATVLGDNNEHNKDDDAKSQQQKRMNQQTMNQFMFAMMLQKVKIMKLQRKKKTNKEEHNAKKTAIAEPKKGKLFCKHEKFNKLSRCQALSRKGWQ